MRRSIEILLFDGVNLLDVSGPVQAFEAAQVHGRKPYELRFVTLDGAAVRASCGLLLGADAMLEAGSARGDLLIPGGSVEPLLTHNHLLDIIRDRKANPNDHRLISICSGALILAAAGVLDDREATTHWTRSKDIQAYDQVRWDLDKIFCISGNVFTSAGVTTGIDLALHIIRQDCGAKIALDCARELVIQLRRSGRQSQFAVHLPSQFSDSKDLSKLIEQVVSQPENNWTIDALSRVGNMNERTLSRRFKREMSCTPSQFVERVRVDHARGLLLEGLALKLVAARSGFGDLQRMRRAFKRRFGLDIRQYLENFGQ